MPKLAGINSNDNENSEQKIINEDFNGDFNESQKSLNYNLPCVTIYMIKLLKQNEKQNFLIDGKEIFQVRLMGRIIDSKEDQLKNTYTMVDESGQIEIVMYKSENKIMSMTESDSPFKYSENCLAEVLGSIQLQKNYLNISATSIENVNSLTKYDKFLLTVALGYCQRNLGICQESFLVEIQEKEKAKENEKGKEEKKLKALNNPQSAQSSSQQNTTFLEIEKKILSILTDSEGGKIGREEIYDRLNNIGSYHDFLTCIKNLVTSGKIKTIDENHFELYFS